MYQTLGRVTLKTGEIVEAGDVTCPDLDWLDRITPLLGHKDDETTWQNKTVLTDSLDIETHFYILHRDGIPFANIMTTELSGVRSPFSLRLVRVLDIELILLVVTSLGIADERSIRAPTPR